MHIFQKHLPLYNSAPMTLIHDLRILPVLNMAISQVPYTYQTTQRCTPGQTIIRSPVRIFPSYMSCVRYRYLIRSTDHSQHVREFDPVGHRSRTRRPISIVPTITRPRPDALWSTCVPSSSPSSPGCSFCCEPLRRRARIQRFRGNTARTK